MSEIWTISYLVLWALVLLLAAAVTILARQIGLLHIRMVPSGALTTNSGPDIGGVVPDFQELDIDGVVVALHQESRKRAFLLFHSPGCSSCLDLMPVIRSMFRTERSSLRLILVSVKDDLVENRRFIEQHRLEGIPYIVSPGLRNHLNVYQVPYALLLNEKGVLLAKGLVNNFHHVESLFNAADIRERDFENSTPERANTVAVPPRVSNSPTPLIHSAGN